MRSEIIRVESFSETGVERLWCLFALTAVLVYSLWLPSAKGRSDGEALRGMGLTVQLQSDAAPYQYFNAEGEAAGVDVEWLRAAATMAGWEGSIRFLRADSDASPAMLAGVAAGPWNGDDLEYCLPHREVELGLFKDSGSLVRGLADLRSKAVAVIENSPSAHYLATHGFESGVRQAGSARAAMEMLAAGEVEAVVMEKQRGLYAMEAQVMGDVTLLQEPVHTLDYGFAMAKGSPELRDALEAGMAVTKRTGQYDRIGREHLVAGGGASREGGSIFAKLRGYAFWVLLPLGLLVAAASLGFLERRKGVDGRIRKLEAELRTIREREEARRAEQARQRFVINRMSTVSLVDQLLSVSKSKDDKQPQETGA
jgi:hypothetical protein